MVVRICTSLKIAEFMFFFLFSYYFTLRWMIHSILRKLKILSWEKDQQTVLGEFLIVALALIYCISLFWFLAKQKLSYSLNLHYIFVSSIVSIFRHFYKWFVFTEQECSCPRFWGLSTTLTSLAPEEDLYLLFSFS